MLLKTSAIAAALAASGLAQVCTLLTPSNCSNSIGPGGGPTLQAYVTGLAASLPAALQAAAPTSQPKTILSGQVIFASQSYMTQDPATCPASGACYFNNPTVIDNMIDSLVTPWPNGAGLKSVDINLWVGPLFESSQYLSYCGTYGTCYTPTANAAWYTASLGTYDTMFAHLAAAWPGVRVRIAPMLSPDAVTLCGLTPVYTEASLLACLAPLWAAMANRWRIDDMTVWHENCGVATLLLGAETGNTNGCGLTIGDEDAMLVSLAATVRATSRNGSIRIGAGAMITDTAGACPAGPASGYPAANTNSWCDWYTNLLPAGTLDFGGLDAYPVPAVPAANYGVTLANYAASAAHVTAIGKPVVANESSAFRWTNGASGEGGTYWGCAADEWRADGTFAAWASAVPGAWAAANGLSIFSLFPIEPLLLTSTNTAYNHCTATDLYEKGLSLKLAAGKIVSPLGLLYAAMAGWNTSLQGVAHLSGVAHLGH